MAASNSATSAPNRVAGARSTARPSQSSHQWEATTSAISTGARAPVRLHASGRPRASHQAPIAVTSIASTPWLIRWSAIDSAPNSTSTDAPTSATWAATNNPPSDKRGW
ncbi:hypothetical protein [Enemella evansiae]|uniref:hypothetical protein n=1 Tax=Enemella evansiae TaxID=2016499 RepID=UPI000B96F689|nr:hypothetical protein [Enemella evansiae]OYO05540.1 hypothetical protein CGZ97_02140 [Enemella evansiae]